jgi:hypothetical protein
MLIVKNRIRNRRRDDNDFSDRRQRIFDFLQANPIGVLSTVNPNAEPHGVVIYFTVDKQFSINFLTRSETRKHDNLEHNNCVMLTVFEPRAQAVVQVTGRAYKVTNSRSINALAGSILGIGRQTSSGGLPPIIKLEAGDFVAFQIVPVQIRMAVYARPDSGEYQDLFESVESFDLE